jgi:hypothetical protein
VLQALKVPITRNLFSPNGINSEQAAGGGIGTWNLSCKLFTDYQNVQLNQLNHKEIPIEPEQFFPICPTLC